MSNPLDKKNYCLNCETPFNTDDRFCKKCGQSTNVYQLTLSKLFSDFFNTLFNWDAKIWITLRDIWVPAKLSLAYVAGKRERYIGPMRFFIVLLFILLALITYRFNHSANNFGDEDVIINATEQKALTKFDSLTIEYPISPIDNINCIREETFKKSLSTNNTAFTIPQSLYSKLADIKLTNHDITYLTPDEIIEQHHITGFANKLIVTQVIRAYKDRKGFARTVIGNSIWIAMLTIFLCACIMKLIYIRGKYYLVEHLVNVIHHHCFIIIILLLSCIFLFWDFDIGKSLPYTMTIIALYIIIALRNYYRQSWFKTIFKMCLIGIGYMIVLFTCVAFVIFISFLIT